MPHQRLGHRCRRQPLSLWSGCHVSGHTFMPSPAGRQQEQCRARNHNQRQSECNGRSMALRFVVWLIMKHRCHDGFFQLAERRSRAMCGSPSHPHPPPTLPTSFHILSSPSVLSPSSSVVRYHHRDFMVPMDLRIEYSFCSVRTTFLLVPLRGHCTIHLYYEPWRGLTTLFSN